MSSEKNNPWNNKLFLTGNFLIGLFPLAIVGLIFHKHVWAMIVGGFGLASIIAGIVCLRMSGVNFQQASRVQNTFIKDSAREYRENREASRHVSPAEIAERRRQIDAAWNAKQQEEQDRLIAEQMRQKA